MHRAEYICDECGEIMLLSPTIELRGNWQTRRAGILMPRLDFHFCSRECLLKWLEQATVKPQ